MTPDELTNFTDYLSHEWDLSETERDDLLSFGMTVAMCECELDTIRIHMEMRAEVLSLVGSDMEEWIEGFKRLYNGG